MADQALLGDTVSRDYSRKLELFNVFAEPELRRIIAELSLSGQVVIDAGCGTGAALSLFSDAVGAKGFAIGFDLAEAHVRIAQTRVRAENSAVVQADLLKPPIFGKAADVVWCMNTINHLRAPDIGVHSLASLARPGGSVVLVQSSLLPDMFFAWDARLEKQVSEAVYRYYRHRYGASERELTAVRGLVGLMRRCALDSVSARTIAIERVSPLSAAEEAYLREAIVGTWGERVRPYLTDEDYSTLQELCDANSSRYFIRRPDFHFIQLLTVVRGYVGGGRES